jgi:uncharacterized protein
MELSRHNILSKVHQTDEYFLINLLSGNADLLSPEEAGRVMDESILDDPEYISKGYVVDRVAEEKLYREKYLDFLDSRETDEIQLFFVPSYACNFNCSYCYQEGYPKQTAGNAREISDAFFSYLESKFIGRRKYITLFGGEPLMAGRENKLFIEYFTRQCRERNIDLAVVTNGYNLEAFVPILSGARIREIQITVDGPEEVHNSRRPLKNGKGTFSQIVMGIDAALAAGMPVNLRVVLDRENIQYLPALAQYAIEKGWTDSSLFKTQLGRNYELHFCQSKQSSLYSRIELYRDLYGLIKEYPHILRFHKPAFSVSKYLFENGELPDPLFDSCPGCKTEWAFDFSGKIYACTATVGKPGEELGTFYPAQQSDNDKIAAWQDRDVLSIAACSTCNLRLACGGGCASIALNRNNDLHAGDCRPVKELMELGISLYS